MQLVMQIPGNGWTLLWVLSKCCTFDWALVFWLNHYFSAGMWWSHGPVGIQDRIERGCPILFLEIYLPTWLVGSVVFDQVEAELCRKVDLPILGTPGLRHPQNPYKTLWYQVWRQSMIQPWLKYNPLQYQISLIKFQQYINVILKWNVPLQKRKKIQYSQ